VTVRACDNPFRVQRLSRLAYRLEGTTWEALAARLERLGWRAALVGPEGRGKSTLLAELARRLAAERGFRLRAATLRRGERRLGAGDRAHLLAGVNAGDLLLVDGAQELAPREWARLRVASRGAGGLLVTSHRPGLLPTLHDCRTSPELLAGLVAELLGGPAGGGATAVLPAPGELFARHGGNVREALLAAYDLYAAATAPARS
jgi:hypothetical protein